MAHASVRSVREVESQLRFPTSSDGKPLPLLRGSVQGSFAHGTISERLPAIIASMLRDLRASTLEEAAASADVARQVEEAVAQLERMRADMQGDRPLVPLPPAPTSGPSGTAATRRAALGAVLGHTNESVEVWSARMGTNTWLGLPWLLVECYMYVRIASVLQSQPALAGLDPFQVQKQAAFIKSQASVVSLAGDVVELLKGAAACGQEELRTRLYAVMQYALWGNKTDLSLLVDASKVDPKALALSAPPAGGGAGQAQPFLIVDEFERLWARLVALRERMAAAAAVGAGPPVRMDVILDNSGLELFSDLCLADFLIEAGLAQEVVLHGKPLPWFVSDTMETDLEQTLQLCEGDPESSTSPAAWAHVRSLASRWRGHLASGRWRYEQHVFWTTPSPFCWMEAVAPQLHQELRRSALLILKGDLNYRKLTFDGCWSWTEEFDTALMGFGPAPMVSLRTLKADVMVGLKPGEGEALGKVDPNWQVNGKFGIIQTSGL